MKKKSVLERISQISAFLSKYIGLIIILLSVIAFFKPSGFAWATSYTSWFLGVAMFGMGLTLREGDREYYYAALDRHFPGLKQHYIEHYGNTSAGTLPLCIWDFENKLKKGDNLIFTAFGAGFAWGAVYVKWGYDGKTNNAC